MQLSTATWAELMRTRTLVGTDAAFMSAVERIQHLSGCRVHIERASHEIRLFGPKVSSDIAANLMGQFQTMCSEQAVQTSNLEGLSCETLQKIAHSGSVSLRIEGQTVSVLGFDFAVVEAANELRRYISSPESFQARDYNVAMGKEVSRLLSTLKPDEVQSNAMMEPPVMPVGHAHATVETWQDTGLQAICPTCNLVVRGNFCVHCGQPSPGVLPSNVMASFTAFPMVQMPHRGTEDHIMSQSKPGTSPVIPYLHDSFGQSIVPMQFMPSGFVPFCLPAGMVPVCDPGTLKGSSCAGPPQQPQQQSTLIPCVPMQEVQGPARSKGKGH